MGPKRKAPAAKPAAQKSAKASKDADGPPEAPAGAFYVEDGTDQKGKTKYKLKWRASGKIFILRSLARLGGVEKHRGLDVWLWRSDICLHHDETSWDGDWRALRGLSLRRSVLRACGGWIDEEVTRARVGDLSACGVCGCGPVACGSELHGGTRQKATLDFRVKRPHPPFTPT